MPAEGRSLGSRGAQQGGKDMGTGESLSASESVQTLQTALHAKAKESPNYDGLENWREAGQAASPVAVPQAQGTGREVRALLG